jgi:hypothetical protein
MEQRSRDNEYTGFISLFGFFIRLFGFVSIVRRLVRRFPAVPWFPWRHQVICELDEFLWWLSEVFGIVMR